MSTALNRFDPVPNERRWTPAAWLTLAVVIAWVVYMVGLSLWSTRIPQDGWMQNGPLDPNGAFSVQYNLAGLASPLQIGDQIIAINGHPLSISTFPPMPTELRVGQTLRYTIERGGHTMDVEIRLVQTDARLLVRGFIERWRETPRDFLVSLFSLLIVAFTFFSRPGNLGARYLFLFFGFYFIIQCFGFLVPQLYVYSFSPVAYLIYSMLPGSWGWYFFPTLILLALAFPVVKTPLRRFPHLLPTLVYGIPLAVWLTQIILELITHDLRWQSWFNPFFISLVASCLIVILVSLVHNWIKIREPIARAQLLWTTLGLGAGLGLMFLIMLIELLVFGGTRSEFDFFLWMPVILPICLAVAITRYHLFDIDLIIRRTLLYASLAAILGLVYFGIVLGLEQLILLAIGQDSPLAVVISTLTIAALFNPLRRRLQAFIDRRFFRQKYDAARAIESFATKARDLVEFDHLTGHLIRVVEETIQPEAISLWLASQKTTSRRIE